MELSQTSVALARERGVGEVIEGSVLEMPFADDSFDLAVSLDVIEHLEDDLAALRELRRTVAPGGALLVTVPAYQWLWSGHDEINHHHRRYTRRSLQRVAEQAGWRQVRTTYFNSLLLPVAILLRVLDRVNTKTTESSLDLWVPAGAAQLAARAPARARGGADRPRRAHPRRALAAGGVPLRDRGHAAVGDRLARPGACTRNVQARLTKNVVTVTTAVAHTCAISLSSWASCTNTYSSPSLSARPQLCTIAQRTGVSASPTCSRNVQRRLSRKPLTAPTAKPIADAARYQTPNTFNSSVYTASVSSVLDTPTMPNFTNWTSTGALSGRDRRATLVARFLRVSVLGRHP